MEFTKPGEKCMLITLKYLMPMLLEDRLVCGMNWAPNIHLTRKFSRKLVFWAKGYGTQISTWQVTWKILQQDWTIKQKDSDNEDSRYGQWQLDFAKKTWVYVSDKSTYLWHNNHEPYILRLIVDTIWLTWKVKIDSCS